MDFVMIMEGLSELVKDMVKTENPGVSLVIAVLITAVFLILFFNFFLQINPFWKKDRQQVSIEAVTKIKGGNFEIDPYYYAKVQAGGQSRHVLCDRKSFTGQEITVFYSPDMIVKNKNYNLSLGRIWIFLFIIIGSGSLINAWMNQTIRYFGSLFLLWIVYPVLYKTYYQWIMKRFLETVELEESGAVEGDVRETFDVYNTDLMEGAPEPAKKALNGFLILLLIAIVAVMLYAISLVIRFIYF